MSWSAFRLIWSAAGPTSVPPSWRRRRRARKSASPKRTSTPPSACSAPSEQSPAISTETSLNRWSRERGSPLDAVGATRERCWKYDWVLEFDIKGLFDNIDHELLLRAVRKHITCKWALLYIERWLKAPMVQEDGTMIERSRGTPQGGVVSPILANLFMHYTFDLWMARTHPDLPWCRYADDGLVHCRTEQEAENLKG